MRIFRGLTRELQSQSSHGIAEKMHDLEDVDMFRFGKTRIARDHYLIQIDHPKSTPAITNETRAISAEMRSRPTFHPQMLHKTRCLFLA